MGMFDYVRFSAPCTNCGEIIDEDWQSKDGDCEMELIEPKDVENFYTHCPKCKTWNDKRVVSTNPLIIEDWKKKNK